MKIHFTRKQKQDKIPRKWKMARRTELTWRSNYWIILVEEKTLVNFGLNCNNNIYFPIDCDMNSPYPLQCKMISFKLNWCWQFLLNALCIDSFVSYTKAHFYEEHYVVFLSIFCGKPKMKYYSYTNHDWIDSQNLCRMHFQQLYKVSLYPSILL